MTRKANLHFERLCYKDSSRIIGRRLQWPPPRAANNRRPVLDSIILSLITVNWLALTKAAPGYTLFEPKSIGNFCLAVSISHSYIVGDES